MLMKDQFVGVVGGNILNGEHLDNLVGVLAGDGSGGGKAKGGELRIAVTLFFHDHFICLQRIAVHQGRTKTKRSEKSTIADTNGDDPSQICSPVGQRGWLKRISCMLLSRRTIAVDIRHARNVLHRSDASDYFSDDL